MKKPCRTNVGAKFLLVMLFLVPPSAKAVSLDVDSLLTQTAGFISSLVGKDSASMDLPLQSLEDIKYKIEEKVNVYLENVKRAHGLLDSPPARTKRSAELMTLQNVTRDTQGVYVLVELAPEEYVIPSKFPQDLKLFHAGGTNGRKGWYAAAIVSTGESPTTDLADELIIYKLQDGYFVEIASEAVQGAVRVESVSISGYVYILAAEHLAHTYSKYGLPSGSVLYKLNHEKDELEKIQTLNTEYPTDVVFWEDINLLYCGIAVSKSNYSGHVSYSAHSLIYSWFGRHFDLITRLKTTGARRLTPFHISSRPFIVVANFIDDNGRHDIDSEIFRYDLNENNFTSFQKIRTYGAVDWRYFSFGDSRKEENFLVVANMCENGPNGKNYKTTSVIYKFAGDYFVPFQSIKTHAAIQWLPVKGYKGEFSLYLACAFQGVKAYQYNGWRFVETAVEFTHGAFGPGVTSLNAFYTDDGAVKIAVGNRQSSGSEVNVFSPNYDYRNDLKIIHKHVEDWCKGRNSRVNRTDLSALRYQIEAAPKLDDESLDLEGQLIFKSDVSHSGKIASSELSLDSIELNSDVALGLNEIYESLKDVGHDLEAISGVKNVSMKINGHNFVEGSLHLAEAELQCDENGCYFGDVVADTVNGEDLETLREGLVYLSDDLDVKGALQFSKIVVNGDLNPFAFNGHDAKRLCSKHSKCSFKEKFSVNGEVSVDHGFNVGGTIDEVQIDAETMLLIDGDQTIKEKLTASSASVKHMTAKYINDLDFNIVFEDLAHSGSNVTLDGHLSVNNAATEETTVDGYINGKSLEELVGNFMRTSEDQKVTGKHHYENLVIGECDINGHVSNQKLDNLVKINDENVAKLYGDLNMKSDLNAERVEVANRLNDLKVTDGKLDVLLKKSNYPQEISGKKTFKNIHLMDNLKVGGKVNDIDLSLWHPEVVIDEDVTVPGDVKLMGATTAKGKVLAGDVRSHVAEREEPLSIQQELDHCLKIDSETIPDRPISFSKPVQILGNLEVGRVSGRDFESLVRIGNCDESQRIYGPKEFVGGFNLGSDASVKKSVSGFNIEELADSLVTTDGDQTLSGRWKVANITANSVSTSYFQLGKSSLENFMLLDEDQSITGKNTIEGSASAEYVKAATVESNGLLMGRDLEEQIADLLINNGSNHIVSAEKSFTKLKSETLSVAGAVGDVDLVEITEKSARNSDHVYIKGNLELEDAEISNLNVKGGIDGIPASALSDQMWLVKSGDQTIKGNLILHSSIKVDGRVTVRSGEVNGINLEDLNNLVRLDDDVSLGDVKFGKIEIEGGIKAETVEGVYLSDALLRASKEEQVVTGEKLFKQDVLVEGNADVSGLVNGVNFTQACSFAIPNSETNVGDLVVKGSATMSHEPIIQALNDEDMTKLKEELWMEDRGTVLQSATFGETVFENSVTVSGLVDGVDLEKLDALYCNKSNDVSVTGYWRFAEGAVFKSSLLGNSASVEGYVNGVNIDLFSKTVLLDGPDQTISSHCLFHYMTVDGDVEVDGYVNKVDLDKDTLRLDVERNVVTGRKRIGTVDVGSLVMNGKNLQGVNLEEWRRQAVGIDGQYSIIGNKDFGSVAVDGILSTAGYVNDVHVDDNLMVTSRDQVVTGLKSLHGEVASGENVLVNGLVAEINLEEFLASLALRNGSITVSAPKEFTSEMTVRYGHVSGLYQGIDLADLLKSPDSYTLPSNMGSRYQKLAETLEKVQKSLSAQAYYLGFYSEIQHIPIPNAIVALLNTGDEAGPLLAVAGEYTVDFLRWDHREDRFLSSGIDSLKVNGISSISTLCDLEDECLLVVGGKFSNLFRTTLGPDERRIKMLDGFKLPFRSVTTLYSWNSKRQTFTASRGVLSNSTMTGVNFILQGKTGRECVLLPGSAGEGSPIICSDGSGDKDDGVHLLQTLDSDRVTAAAAVGKGKQVFLLLSSDQGRVPYYGTVDVWRFDARRDVFRIDEHIKIPAVRDVAAIHFDNECILALASGTFEGAPNAGFVEIKRLDNNIGHFVHASHLPGIVSPTAVKFHALASNQLVLYVLTEGCPYSRLIVFRYIGTGQFVKHTEARGLPESLFLLPITLGNLNLLIVGGPGGATVLKAEFKGQPLDYELESLRYQRNADKTNVVPSQRRLIQNTP